MLRVCEGSCGFAQPWEGFGFFFWCPYVEGKEYNRGEGELGLNPMPYNEWLVTDEPGGLKAMRHLSEETKAAEKQRTQQKKDARKRMQEEKDENKRVVNTSFCVCIEYNYRNCIYLTMINNQKE